MSKRKRTDFEDGIQTASGTNYSAHIAAAAVEMTYDDAPSPPSTVTAPAPAAASPSKTLLSTSDTISSSVAPHAAPAGRKQISYQDTSAADPAPQGPYSYTAEKREQLYFSGNSKDEGAQGQKRPRHEQRKNKPRVDERFGQFGAFPEPEEYDGGIERGQDGAEGEAGQGREAWEYLRQVREEANGLPAVLSAEGLEWGREDGQAQQGEEDWDAYEEEYEDDELYFEDGVCYAAPETPVPEKVMTAQDLYYQALCKRFERDRGRMVKVEWSKTTKPPGHVDKVSGLPYLLSAKDLFKAKNSRGGRPSLFGFAGPTLRLISALDNEHVLKILTVLDEDIDEAINKQENLPASFGSWAWMLLSRLGDKGSLWSEQIVLVRDLAKRAGWALAALKIGTMQREAGIDILARERSATNGAAATIDTDMEDGEVEEEPAASTTAEDTGPKEPVPNQSTMATLHAIITIAGEFYGQRDLLDSRLPWFD
ncbi:Hypothetical protein D9617_29g007320 [Elsinoe fawcettii]|nr:Hypothetical protein D9617_29g007320 [Elsinoe fawcettii]